MFTAIQLHSALEGIGVRTPGDIFNRLAIAYSEPQRHYHNQTHIEHCLTLARGHRAIATFPDELEIALWFHDAIYDPSQPDNEEQSAQWAQDYLQSIRVDVNIIDRVVAMILATKTHIHQSGDTALLLDIDLSILGAPWLEFEAYDQAIRHEYQSVPKTEYCQARYAILQSFLEKDTIYQTPEFQQHHETQARKNLINKSLQLLNLSEC